MEWMTPATVLGDLPPGATVVAGNACGTPQTLLRAVGAQAERVGDLTLTTGLLLGDLPFADALRSGALSLRSWHIFGPQRLLWREHLVQYLPIRITDIPKVVLDDVDVALVCLSPPDVDGMCSLGPSTTFSQALISSARLVVAEVSDAVPRTRGDSLVHVSRVDRAVRTDAPVVPYLPAAPDPVAAAVARNVVGVIDAGSTVQLGIGSVGEALAIELASVARAKSLGLVGMVTESMVPLIEAIAESGRGPVLAVEVMGGAELMSWAVENPALEMRSLEEIHNPRSLSELSKFVSVNSAIALDLAGQVVAETINGATISGVGGSVDFFEGAHLSPGGMRVIALRSTAGANHPTIVPVHGALERIAIPHHSVDVVVTEHGVAHLAGRTLAERAAALIEVAAPEHRQALSTYAGAIDRERR